MNPFATKRPKAKRKDPRRVGPDRVRLYGQDKSDLRTLAYLRAAGICEREAVTGKPHHHDCPMLVQLHEGHLAHRDHGPRKTDTLAGTYWASAQCHLIEDHNPKACPRKPGRKMNLKEAKDYWQGETCFCGGPKKSQESFCPTCTMKLNPQTKHGLEHSDDPDDYREWLATAEMEILGK